MRRIATNGFCLAVSSKTLRLSIRDFTRRHARERRTVPRRQDCDRVCDRAADDGVGAADAPRAHTTDAVVVHDGAVSYGVWVSVFGVYRYVLSLEMLAPLLVALALSVCRWRNAHACDARRARRWQSPAPAGVGFRSAASAGAARYVDATVPPIADPDHTLVVMAGSRTDGLLVPAFPPQIPFLRIDGWLDSPSSHSAFGDRMRARIDAHDGPIFGMFIEHERDRAVAAFEADGLMLANADCATIRSNIGEPLQWCALQRKASREALSE